MPTKPARQYQPVRPINIAILDGVKIRVYCDYADNKPVQAAGGMWDAVTKSFTMPFTARNYLQLKHRVPHLRFDPFLDKQYEQQKKIEDRLVIIREMAVRDKPVQFMIPELKMSQFNYQKIGTMYATAGQSGVLMADDMGLGKSNMSIATACVLKREGRIRNCLCVVPASVKFNWPLEIEKFTDEKYMVVDGSPDERVRQWLNEDAFFTIVNYELLQEDLFGGADMTVKESDSAQTVMVKEKRARKAANRQKLLADIPKKYDMMVLDECFGPKTRVLTPRGSKQISKIRYGETVWTVGPDGLEIGTVGSTYMNPLIPPNGFWTVKCKRHTIDKVTANHRIYMADGSMKRVDQLQPGDVVRTAERTVSGSREGILAALLLLKKFILKEGKRGHYLSTRFGPIPELALKNMGIEAEAHWVRRETAQIFDDSAYYKNSKKDFGPEWRSRLTKYGIHLLFRMFGGESLDDSGIARIPLKEFDDFGWVGSFDALKAVGECHESGDYMWIERRNLVPLDGSCRIGPSEGVDEVVSTHQLPAPRRVNRYNIEVLPHHNYVVADEGPGPLRGGILVSNCHAIKNHQAKRTKNCKAFNTKFRMGLSGTPLDGRLEDLWSIMDWIQPGLLGSRTRFMQNHAVEDQWGRVVRYLKVDVVRDKIKPFFLRRMKEQVLKDLPPRTDVTRYVTLSPNERRIYKDLVDKAHNLTEDSQALSIILRCRQLCLHPSLIQETGESNKFLMWQEIMEELLENNHKVVVFSQFAEMCKILCGWLKKKGIKHLFLYGETPKRDRADMQTMFNDKSATSPRVIVGTEAMSTGLNLVGSSYVVHYDESWQPAIMRQRCDRVRRLGQESDNVTSISLICRDTVEGRVRVLLESKQEISDEAMGDDILMSTLETIDAAPPVLNNKEILGLL